MRGGKRSNAGRKPGSTSKNRDEVKQLIDAIAKKRFGKKGKHFIFNQLFTLAEGVPVVETIDGVHKTFYTKEPNEKALECLAAYRHSRPPQSVALSSEDRTSFVSIVYEK